MCKKLICLMTFVLLLGLSSTALATTYYVSPSGNDNNSGTSKTEAWQTIGKVNSMMPFAAGDSILFEGGQTFTAGPEYRSIGGYTVRGGLFFTSGGTPTNPITISSYGTGRATLYNPYFGTDAESDSSAGIFIYECAGLDIKDLIFAGQGNNRGVNWQGNCGIRFRASNDYGYRHERVYIDNCEIKDYSGYGFFAGTYNDTYDGLEDVRITNCLFHNICKEAICSEGPWMVKQATHTDFYIADNTMYHITGTPDKDWHSGSGINLAGVHTGLIEFNEAYECGGWCQSGGGGPLAIWCWESEYLIFQFNEAHNQQTLGGDGGGFDLDGGTSFSTMQYNYSHDNFGGDLLMQFSQSRYAGDNIYRYNINANQCQFNSMGAITFYSDATLNRTDVYNNTIYVGPDSLPSASAIDIWVWHGQFRDINIRNNIFIAEAGKKLIKHQTLSGFTFQGNSYWQSGEPLVITDGSTTYSSLDAWRTATGQEMLDGSPVGLEIGPQLVDVHSHPVLGPHNLTNLSGYKLKSTSQCRDAGLDLQALFGIDPGTQDYYGNGIPQGSLFDIGAHEYPGGGSAPAPDGTAPSAPSGLTATSTGTGIDLDWANNTESDMSHYSVKRSTTAGGPYTQIISNLNASSYTDKKIIPSTTYYYVVTATDTSSNQSGNSSEASATFTYAGVLIFSDDFESGGFTAGGWETGGDATVESSAAYEGSYGVKLVTWGKMWKVISTEGYTDLRIKYMRSTTKGHQSVQELIVKWDDGFTIYPIDKIGGDTPWAPVDVILCSDADNNPDFRLYFFNRAGNPNANYSYVDNVEIWGVSGAPDTTPPEPDPMTWAVVPYATGPYSIAMVATTATDASGVEYYFDCTTTGGHDSAWQNSTSYEDTGLSPETTYTYQVKARDKSVNKNETGWSTQKSATTEAEDTTPPAAPESLTATAISSSQIDLDWADNTEPDLSHYNVKRSTTAGGPYTQIATDVTVSAYSDTGLSASTTYYYVVTAVDTSNNESGNSNEASATTEAGAPVLFSDGFESANFTAGGWTTWESVTPSGVAEVTDKVSYTGTYAALIRGTAWIEKALSTSGYTGIHVKYARMTESLEAGEYLYAEWYDGSSWYELEAVTDAEPWAVKDWTLGTGANNNPDFKIRFRINGTNAANDKGDIDDVEVSGTSGAPDTTPPTPDPMTWATVPYATGPYSIAMVATTASDPSGVEYYFDCLTTGGHDSAWQNSTSYEDTGLSPETTYTYQVKARDKSANLNETSWSASKSATTEPEAPPDTTPPSPDPMTWATLPYATGTTSIAMVATTATDESGVEYYFDCLTTGGHDSGWQAGTSYTDTGLDPDTQYCYQVRARDKSPNQNATGWSTTECATTEAEAPPDTTPPSPDPMTWATLPYATGTSSIAMVATTATDESGVEYYFDETSGNPGGTNSGWQDSTSYTDTGLDPDTQYCYQVQARDKSPNQNATSWSTTECATTEAEAPPDTTPPTPDPMTWATLPYATSSTSISMTATTATDPSGVEYYFDCTAGGGNDSGWQDSSSYEDTGLTCETSYSYRVQARDKSPNQNATGWSTTESATTDSCGVPGQLFWDGFESGGFTEGGWTTTGSCAVTFDGPYEGTYHAVIKLLPTMTTSVNTSGYTNIHLKFAGYTQGFDAGEYITSEWYDGSSWQVADQLVSNGSYSLSDTALPSGAANNPSFKIRFSTNSDKQTEWARLDAVEVTGQ